MVSNSKMQQPSHNHINIKVEGSTTPSSPNKSTLLDGIMTTPGTNHITAFVGSALTPNVITFTKVGIIQDEDDDEAEVMEIEEEEDQISDVTSPSSEDASFHTLSETSSMIEDGSDAMSIADSSTRSSGSKRKLDEVLSSENGHEETKVVKRRIYHRRANPFPRVLKRDIRRDYGTMLINVMNSFDGELTTKFFRTFCVQDCYKFDLFPEVKNYNLPCVRQVNGLDQIVYSLLHDLSHTPDCVLKMQSSHIRQRSDIKGSQVVLRVIFQGTKIYQNKNCNVEASQQQQQQQITSTSSSSSSRGLSTIANGSSPMSDNESDVNSVYSYQSMKSITSKKSVMSDIGSMWLPLPPTVDENALKSLDLQAIEKYFENISKSTATATNGTANGFSGHHHHANGSSSSSSSSLPPSSSAASTLQQQISSAMNSTDGGIQQTLSNILQQFPQHGTNQEQTEFINELMRGGNIDITKDEWYENAGISLLSKPFPITVDGTIIMHLDEDHRIRRFQFVSSSLVANKLTNGLSSSEYTPT